MRGNTMSKGFSVFLIVVLGLFYFAGYCTGASSVVNSEPEVKAEPLPEPDADVIITDVIKFSVKDYNK